MKEPEQNARHRLNVQLANLGWELDGVAKNVYFEGECKTEAQKQALEGARPDYVLYRAGTVTPLAVVEAKRPGRRLGEALAQGQGYARKLGVGVVFASDGGVVRACDAEGAPLLLDGVRIDALLPEHMVARLAEGQVLATAEKVIRSRLELIKIFAKAEKLLRREGIDVGMQSIYEFCIILFMKIHSELQNDGRWRALCAADEETVLAVYADTVRVYKAKYRDVFRETNIAGPAVLQEIVAMLERVNLIDSDIDVKGEAYEFFLKRYSRQNKSALGQHFTPRHITDMMTVLLDPAVGEKIYDPFCGTGGMLMSCYKFMRRNVVAQSEVAVLNGETLFGRDINYGTSQLAKMNMIIVGDGSSNIENKDSLAAPARRVYDKVISNIPFNLSGVYPGGLYGSSQKNGNVVCLLHCLDAVRVGGCACVIVPENFCYDAAYAEAREEMLGRGRLKALIRLPRATFKSYTTARTCVLWFVEVGRARTSEFHYVDVRYDGFSDSVWREPIDENEVAALLENREDLSVYPKIAVAGGEEWVAAAPDARFCGEFWMLRDVIALKAPEAIEADEKYFEPKLCSHTNTVRRRGQARYGRNMRGGGAKVRIAPGDLVIATLHTNSGRGLFAISDDYYVATSQIVATIREELVDREFLVHALRRVLPRLEARDLVGRETFRKADILDVRIPRMPAFFAGAEYKRLAGARRRAEAAFEARMAVEMRKVFGD